MHTVYVITCFGCEKMIVKTNGIPSQQERDIIFIDAVTHTVPPGVIELDIVKDNLAFISWNSVCIGLVILKD